VTPQQARLIRSSVALFRRHLGRFLQAAKLDGEIRKPRFGALHSILVTLAFVRVALQELAPEHLRGYGAMAPESESALRGVCNQLEGLVSTLETELRRGGAADLEARLERMADTDLAALLRLLDRIITEEQLAEFRPALVRLVEKLESPAFEVAAFGRVSSGKSSLLNRLLGADVLPVGVTPVTAVPVRLVYGERPSLTVHFAGGRTEQRPLEDLPLFAAEEHNPANQREVLRLIVRMPSPLLRDGVVFVDTPGLGSLAVAGAAETLSYLPRCDLGLVLVSAVTPLNEEDLATVDLLLRSGTPPMILLSKADLLAPGELEKAARYTEAAIERELGARLRAIPVSVAATHSGLLESWMRESLQPVLARHKELAAASLERKAAALGEAVAQTLRGRYAGVSPIPRAAVEQAEDALRRASSALETGRREALRDCDRLRGETRTVLAEAAERAFRQGAGRDPEAWGRALREAALRACDAAAGELKRRAEQLCALLLSALETARNAMRPGAEPAGPGLECSQIGALPVPVLEAIPAAVPAGLAAVLGPPGRSLAARILEKRAGAAVQRTLEAYARSLESWLQREFDNLQTRFDAEAGVFLAEIARITSADAAGAERRPQVEKSLQELELLLAKARGTAGGAARLTPTA